MSADRYQRSLSLGSDDTINLQGLPLLKAPNGKPCFGTRYAVDA